MGISRSGELAIAAVVVAALAAGAAADHPCSVTITETRLSPYAHHSSGSFFRGPSWHSRHFGHSFGRHHTRSGVSVRIGATTGGVRLDPYHAHSRVHKFVGPCPPPQVIHHSRPSVVHVVAAPCDSYGRGSRALVAPEPAVQEGGHIHGGVTTRGAAGHVHASVPRVVPGARTAAGWKAEDGWTSLAEGRADEARRVFASVAPLEPREVSHRLGYALAAAAGGDVETAAWAMRRAMLADAGRAVEAAQREEAAAVLDDIVTWAREAAAEADSRDAWFVLACVEYLRGEEEPAGRALERAMVLGDRGQGVTELAAALDITPRRVAGWTGRR